MSDTTRFVDPSSPEEVAAEFAAAKTWRIGQDEKVESLQTGLVKLSEQVALILKNQESYQQAIEKRFAVEDNDREHFFKDQWEPLVKMVQDVRNISNENTVQIGSLRSLSARIEEKVNQLSTEVERMKGRVDQIERAQHENKTQSKVSDTKLAILAGILIFLAPTIIDRLFPKAAPQPVAAQPQVVYVVPQGSQPQMPR